MKLILHGENTEESRAKLNALRSGIRDADVRLVDGRTAEIDAIIQSLESGSLFQKRILVIYENLLSFMSAKKKVIEPILKVLEKSQDNTDIILWEKKDISPSILKALGSFKIEHFSYPKTLFGFLDSLSPADTVRSLKLYHDTLLSTAPEVVFVLMVRRVRDLLMVKDNTLPPKSVPWQVERLRRQAGLFSRDELIAWYKALFRIEYTIKTSTAPLTLTENIEACICSLYRLDTQSSPG